MIEHTQANLAKLRLDHDEAQKITAESLPHQEELYSKEERLKALTYELNQVDIESEKKASKSIHTCYFDRAKMKRDKMRLTKNPKTPKDKAESNTKKAGNRIVNFESNM